MQSPDEKIMAFIKSPTSKLTMLVSHTRQTDFHCRTLKQNWLDRSR
jgi:hypothetical protein